MKIFLSTSSSASAQHAFSTSSRSPALCSRTCGSSVYLLGRETFTSRSPSSTRRTRTFGTTSTSTLRSGGNRITFLDAEAFSLTRSTTSRWTTSSETSTQRLSTTVLALNPAHILLETCPVRWKNLQNANSEKYQAQLDAINTLHGGLLSRDLLELKNSMTKNITNDTKGEDTMNSGATSTTSSTTTTFHPCDQLYRQTQNDVAKLLFLKPWLLFQYAKYAKQRLADVSRRTRLLEEQRSCTRHADAGDGSGGMATGGANSGDVGVLGEVNTAAAASVNKDATTSTTAGADTKLPLPLAMVPTLIEKRAEHFAKQIERVAEEKQADEKRNLVVVCATREFRQAVEKVLEKKAAIAKNAQSIEEAGSGNQTPCDELDELENNRGDRGRTSSFSLPLFTKMPTASSCATSSPPPSTTAGPLWPFFFSFFYLVLPISITFICVLSFVKGCILGLIALAQNFLLKGKEIVFGV
ncbi:unnamed protein product [Amoebophrya sp. A120]|nr:unnamed protein product [Amoebophrya sp. A120]|eukprot:GSA120T00019285001.1